MTRTPHRSPPAFGGTFDPVAQWAATAGERVAIIDDDADRRISYAQLHQDAEWWCAQFDARGVSSGDRVAVLAHNRYEFVPLLFACIRTGALLVPLNRRLAPQELSRVLQHAEPSLIVGEEACRELAAPYLASGSNAARWLDLDDVPHHEDERGRSVRSVADAWAGNGASSAPAMLLYTSGSTGEPKGVVVPQAQLHWNAVSTCEGWALHADDVGQVITPLFHTAGWHVCLTPLLWCGGAVVLQRGFQADACLEAMARHGTTITFAVPTQLDQLRRAATWGRPLPQLRTIISGGASCPPHTLAAVRAAGYPVRDAYGLTECGPNCFRATFDELSACDGSVGWPLPYLETRIVDHAGALLPPGETGELQLRGPQLFAGYFRDPEGTARALTADGWLRTGDVAAVDADGAHAIRGRLGDMFISGGENVFPAEVELALRRCTGVRDAVVVGVPDATWGEVGHAVVVAEPGAIDVEALRREARTWLAGYKLPRHVTVVQDLPRLGSGKVDRQAVRALVTPSAGAPRAR